MATVNVTIRDFIARLAIRHDSAFLAPRDSRDSRFGQPCPAGLSRRPGGNAGAGGGGPIRWRCKAPTCRRTAADTRRGRRAEGCRWPGGPAAGAVTRTVTPGPASLPRRRRPESLPSPPARTDAAARPSSGPSLPHLAAALAVKNAWGFPCQFIKSTKVLVARTYHKGAAWGTTQWHTPEQVSNQEPPDSRPGVSTTTLLGGG